MRILRKLVEFSQKCARFSGELREIAFLPELHPFSRVLCECCETLSPMDALRDPEIRPLKMGVIYLNCLQNGSSAPLMVSETQISVRYKPPPYLLLFTILKTRFFTSRGQVPGNRQKWVAVFLEFARSRWYFAQ